MFETCHTRDADFNSQRLANIWEAITMDTEVVITPHPLNVETEMTLCEFTELLTRVALFKTKMMKKMSPAERVEDFMHSFFLKCNQIMPVADGYLEKAQAPPFEAVPPWPQMATSRKEDTFDMARYYTNAAAEPQLCRFYELRTRSFERGD